MTSRDGTDSGITAMPVSGTQEVPRTSQVMLFQVLLLLAALTALFWPTLQSLIVEWRDQETLTYTHGYLIAAICCWLIVRSARAPCGAVTPDWRMVPVLMALSLLWVLVYRAGIELAHQVLLPLLGLLAVCVATGIRNGLRFWFAFAYLYFAVPVWNVGNEILQSFTVMAVQLLLQVTSVPAYVSGNMVYIPSGTFEIAGGCSGLHYFIVALALAALFGEIHRDSTKVRVYLLALAAVLAVLSNWIRVYSIILAGHLTGMQHYLVRVDHYYFGWVMFAVTMVVFFVLASRLPAQSRRAEPELGTPATHSPKPDRMAVLGPVVAIAALSLGPLWGAFSPVAAAMNPSASLLPPAEGPWQGPYPATAKWHPAYPGSDRSERGEYRRGDHRVSAFVAEYHSQRQDKELVGYANSITHGLSGEISRLAVPHGAVNQLLVTQADGDQSVVIYYYQVGAQRVVGDFAAQLQYGMASLFAATASRVVAVHVQCDSDCAAASGAARELLNTLDASLN